jgi:hypothetical protein
MSLIDAAAGLGWDRASLPELLVSDAGYFSSGLTESFPPATGITNYLSGRV